MVESIKPTKTKKQKQIKPKDQDDKDKKLMLPSTRASNFILTFNNPEENGMIRGQEKEFVEENIYSTIPSITYLNGQYEIGEEEKTPHLQIFIKVQKSIRVSQVISELKSGKGGGKISVKAAYKDNGVGTYCMKSRGRLCEPFEFGTKPQKNSVINYQNELNLINQGKIKEINPKLLFNNYNNVQKLNQKYLTQTVKDHDNYRGIWIWGPSHVGKSTFVRKAYPNASLKLIGTEWFDTYDPEDHSDIILNDFGLNHKWLGDYLKIWADRWANPIQIKNSATLMNWNNFIVTSQYSMDQIWKNDKETLDALKVRFKNINIKDPIHKKVKIMEEYDITMDENDQLHLISKNTDEELKILGIPRDQIIDLSDESLVGGLRSEASRLKIQEIKLQKLKDQNINLNLKEQENRIEFINMNEIEPKKTKTSKISSKNTDEELDELESFENSEEYTENSEENLEIPEETKNILTELSKKDEEFKKLKKPGESLMDYAFEL